MKPEEGPFKEKPIEASFVIGFWQKAGPEKWFISDPDFDEDIKTLFGCAPEQALSGSYDKWGEQASECLALILILDQFPRNIFRGSPKAFAFDEAAKTAAKKIIEQGFDQSYQLPLKRFLYLPFMHSEKLEDQRYCIELCEKANDPDGVNFGQIHLDVIEKFNRFPHRNEVLGRQSTPEEIKFLKDGGFQA
jgi:uncharacterized protein (DUF924 family)